MTFSLAADEARRFGGEVVPLDVDTRAVGMNGLVHRFPVGPISAISPFNFPLNLLAHKVAPAIAVGSALVVKPPPQCPQLRLPAGRDPGRLRPCRPAPTTCCTCRSRWPSGWPPTRASSCSPSPAARRSAGTSNRWPGRRRSCSSWAATPRRWSTRTPATSTGLRIRLAFGGFAYAGQVCIKVQRVLVHGPIYDALRRQVCRRHGRR